ncbi:MAG: hypothetical protein BGO68_03780 [Candidatus Amoebophilus sp. 36-38]|nr:MAG: hypothetical protein BGO68_03780 [Candidatus Amoebophilus sp. 36-38]
MLNQNKFFKEEKLFKQASIIPLIFFIVLFNLAAMQANTQSNASLSKQPSNMIKVGLTDIPEKEEFNLEYLIKEKAYLKLLENDIIPYLQQKKIKSLTCFMSYAWGDSYHEYWVKRFSEMLHKAGIQVLLDRWAIKKGTVLAEFIKKIGEADWVVVVGTKLYLEKCNKRAENVRDKEPVVKFEAQLIEYLVGYSAQRGDKVIPILLEGTPEEGLPFMLRPKVFIDFSRGDYFEELLKLIRDLYDVDHRDKVFETFIERFKKYAAVAAANITEQERKEFQEKRAKEILKLDKEVSEEIDAYKKELLKKSTD